MKKGMMTIDEALRPLEMTCCNCGGKMKAYPNADPKGIGYCPNCSPVWLKSFAVWGMNQERMRHGLNSIEG